MNLVNMIESQLSDAVMSKLSSLLGTGEESTRSAVGAAVPALFSGLSNLASAPGGAQKLISALGKFDAGSLGNLTNMLTANPGALLDQGSSLLSSLLGGNLLSTITGALTRFTGIGSGSSQKLLGYLMPLVLGGVAKRFAGKTITPDGLMSMFAEQKANLAEALPDGFSLGNLPGAATAAAGAAAGAAAAGAEQAGSSLLRWLLPLAAVALIALALWAAFRPTTPPSSPTVAIPEAGDRAGKAADVGQIQGALTDNFKSASNWLSDITDAASATAAVPKLTELSTKLAGMKAAVDKLPEAARAKINELVKSKLEPLDEQLAKLQWIPGVGDKIKPVADQLIDRFASLGGVQAPQAAKVSGELAGAVASVTNALAGIKDGASAEAAIPKLQEVEGKLDSSAAAVTGLPPSARSTVSALIKAAIPTLRHAVDKVVSVSGVGDKIKPVVDAIMSKLSALAA
jgi:hypothetical protein